MFQILLSVCLNFSRPGIITTDQIKLIEAFLYCFVRPRHVLIFVQGIIQFCSSLLLESCHPFMSPVFLCVCCVCIIWLIQIIFSVDFCLTPLFRQLPDFQASIYSPIFSILANTTWLRPIGLKTRLIEAGQKNTRMLQSHSQNIYPVVCSTP